MKVIIRRIVVSAIVVSGVLFATNAHAQPGVPTPGPELKQLEQHVGTWDCTVKAGPETSKGTAEYRMGVGGLWLISNFKGELGGQKFEGHGLDSYDAAKGKYVSVWVDSMSTSPLLMEGTYDAAKKTLTMIGEGMGPDGKPMKMTGVTRFTSADTIEFSLSGPGEGGKPMEFISITYKKRK